MYFENYSFKTIGHKTSTSLLMMMILHIAETAILAHSWLVLVETYELNRMPQCGVVICKRMGDSEKQRKTDTAESQYYMQLYITNL